MCLGMGRLAPYATSIICARLLTPTSCGVPEAQEKAKRGAQTYGQPGALGATLSSAPRAWTLQRSLKRNWD
jgi:hypothetical protein